MLVIMLTLENGIKIQPVYLCNDSSPHCKDPSCKVDAGSCRHTLNDLYAKNSESVRVFNEFMKRFKPTIYFDANTATRIKSEVKYMTDEKLKRANDLRACLDVLKEFKEIFETKPQLSINQIGTSRLTDDILTPWKELNIEFIDECIENVEKEFKKL